MPRLSDDCYPVDWQLEEAAERIAEAERERGDRMKDDYDYMMAQADADEATASASAAAEAEASAAEHDYVARLEKQNADLLAALEKARETIQSWHGMGAPKKMQEQLWKLYQGSPEMKQINEAIKAAKEPKWKNRSNSNVPLLPKN